MRSTAKPAAKGAKGKAKPKARETAAEPDAPERAERPLTVKQEAFARAYIENNGNASEAYRQAYTAENMTAKTVWEAACRTLATRKVSARIDELRAEIALRNNVTADDIVRELEEARKLAAEKGQATAMVAATMGKAKISGLLVDRAELTGKNGAPLHPELVVTFGADLKTRQAIEEKQRLDAADKKKFEDSTASKRRLGDYVIEPEIEEKYPRGPEYYFARQN
jgi:phage terminase small subunit